MHRQETQSKEVCLLSTMKVRKREREGGGEKDKKKIESEETVSPLCSGLKIGVPVVCGEVR